MELWGGCSRPSPQHLLREWSSEPAGLFCGNMALLGIKTLFREQVPSSVGNLSRSEHKTVRAAPSVDDGPPERGGAQGLFGLTPSWQTLSRPKLRFVFIFSLMGAFPVRMPLSEHLLSLVREWSLRAPPGPAPHWSFSGERSSGHQSHHGQP